MFEPRFYRKSGSKKFKSYQVCYKETDLHVFSPIILKELCFREVRKLRLLMEDYLKKNPVFLNSLLPVCLKKDMPLEMIEMVKASTSVGVGPMAAVAGVFAERVGRKVLEKTDEVIVENGGDIFIRVKEEMKIGVFAGKESPFSNKLAIKIKPMDEGQGICSSSGKIGPSYSEGRADLVTIISSSTVLADATATAAANKVQSKNDIPEVIDWVQSIRGISGVLIIKDDQIGVQGELELLKYTND